MQYAVLLEVHVVHAGVEVSQVAGFVQHMGVGSSLVNTHFVSASSIVGDAEPDDHVT